MTFDNKRIVSYSLVQQQSMNILIIYATNSGGTEHVANLIADVLRGGQHTVTVQHVRDTKADQLSGYDGILFGSPSWDYNGKEGQLHEEMRVFVEDAAGISLEGKKVAVFGLGDSSYMYFTGAVNHLEKFVADCHSSLLVPSLRIDGFYFDLDTNEQRAKEWAQDLATQLG